MFFLALFSSLLEEEPLDPTEFLICRIQSQLYLSDMQYMHDMQHN